MERFPVGGPRQPVYDFVHSHGFVIRGWGDKEWSRHDGVTLHIYGAGSMARIYDAGRTLLIDAPLAEAVAKADMKRHSV